MDLVIQFLAANQLVLLFAIIGLGYLFGNINISGFKLGVAAVLFVGIAFGAIDKSLALPDHIYVIGLVLFVYTIGLHSGPGFFASFHKKGLKFSLAAALVLCLAALLTFVLAWLFSLSPSSAAGLFCGALTNTPALAAVIETTQNLTVNLAPEIQKMHAGSPIVTYGLAYPFGVFGVILWIFLFNKVNKVNLEVEEADVKKAAEREAILSHTFLISNPGVFGKTVSEVFLPIKDQGFVLTRIQKGKKTELVDGRTVLDKGDLVVAVGDADAMNRASLLFGQDVRQHLTEGLDGFTYRRIFVSNKAVVGKTLRELNVHHNLQATVTRLRRGDVDMVPTPDTMLEMGDRIRVMTHSDNMEKVTQFFGDSLKSVSQTDYLSLSLGIVLGVMLGMIPIPLAGGLHFKLGFAGGPLIVGLILGRLTRTGKIIWEIPFSANLVLRQVGLVFFLAAIGTKAGFGFVDTFKSGGWELILSGALITTVVTLTTLTIGYKYFKLPMVAVMGMMSGIQTQPAVLAYANQQTESDLPNVWYSTVFPASMVAKIILGQLIVSLLF